MPQIEKPDDLQSIANLTRFFSYALQSPSMYQNVQKQAVACNLGLPFTGKS